MLKGFKRFTQPKAKKRGRSPKYDREAILRPLKEIWLAANLPCSKRLKAIVPLWLPGYSQACDPDPLQEAREIYDQAGKPLTETDTDPDQSMG